MNPSLFAFWFCFALFLNQKELGSPSAEEFIPARFYSIAFVWILGFVKKDNGTMKGKFQNQIRKRIPFHNKRSKARFQRLSLASRVHTEKGIGRLYCLVTVEYNDNSARLSWLMYRICSQLFCWSSYPFWREFGKVWFWWAKKLPRTHVYAFTHMRTRWICLSRVIK